MARMGTRRLVMFALAFALSSLHFTASVQAAPVTKTSNPGYTSAAPVLPWSEDDYMRAVAEAKARQLPLFVESWAPW
jgi:hypothetical protein